MNKSQLVNALAARIGDRRMAATAVDGLIATIVDTVKDGESVSISGFGVFERRARAARVARNPRTGEAVAVPAATVPAFRPGSGFRSAVGGEAAGGTPEPRAVRTRGPKATPAAAPARSPRRTAASADDPINGVPVAAAARASGSFAAESEVDSKPAKKAKAKKDVKPSKKGKKK